MTGFRSASSRSWAGLVALVFLTGVGCGDEPPTPTSILFTAIDPTVDPCQDFYQYACGNWLATHPIFSDGSYRRRFDDPFYEMVPKLRAQIEADAAHTSSDPQAQLIGDYYTSCLVAPSRQNDRALVTTMLRSVGAASSVADLAAVIADLRLSGSGSFFRVGVGVDEGAPTQRAVYLEEGGIELPEPDDYLDPGRADLRAAYRLHIATLADFFRADAPIDADTVIAVESALAAATRDPAGQRDPRATYNPTTVDELTALSPTFPWKAYLAKLGFADVTRVVLTNPAFFKALDAVLTTTPLSSLRSYVAWQVIQDETDWLDQAVLDADFPFWAQEYTGQPEPSSRAWSCLNATMSTFGMAVSQGYTRRFVPPSVRAEASAMLTGIRASMGRHLVDAPWLDDATRAEAMAKLDAMIPLVAYPDSWPTYEGLAITSGSYLANHLALAQWKQRSTVTALGRPVARDTWTMTPITVNASYQETNSMQFPAAILQLPFFAVGHSAAGNYGGIGYVMGHEMTHGFDDAGRQFDGTGLLRDWWTPAVDTGFRSRAQCLIDQFSGYTAGPGLVVDGALTLGENTADLGGVRVAYDALMAAHPDELIREGYDSRQQFFLAFAQVHCANVRPELLSDWVMTDPHSPSSARVNGTLVNVPAFSEAFGCGGPAPTSAVPAGRTDICEVW